MADFLVIDPRRFGHVYDPYATLVFVTSQPDLERVYVGGELMVEHGVPLKQDLTQGAARGRWTRRAARQVSSFGDCRYFAGMGLVGDSASQKMLTIQ